MDFDGNYAMFDTFKYYNDLNDRAIMALDAGGGLSPVRPVPRTRIMHSDILTAVLGMLKGEPDRIMAWRKLFTWSWFNWIPDYFFVAPASATHKYHPHWASRPDGLLLHSLAVCRVAMFLADLFPDMSVEDTNVLLCAAWHHDMFKYGDLDVYEEGKMTVHEHPVLAGGFFRLPAVIAMAESFGISGSDMVEISDLVSTHAGPYRASRFSDLRLPACTGPRQVLLYKSDYFASRREEDFVKDLLVPIP